ncbi:hypothetical protein BLD48_10165 [Exiguobacterium sp. KRL4]|uniref:hypothetical protein n=1 Tax=Exiguobacterium sp. KRL4 TaxID=1914536 RepID=UPI0008F86D66|nr:hypothetical protein [Exiguobacterium sp. KRL4]OIN66668.1 hypothetical protein BLD48_10165 [Exiguobacterium sp. KRL4]
MSRLIRFELYKLCKSITVLLFIVALLLYLMSSVFSEDEANVRAKYVAWEGPATAEAFEKIELHATKINDNTYNQFGPDVLYENKAIGSILDIQEAQLYKTQTLSVLSREPVITDFEKKDRTLHIKLLQHVKLDMIKYHIPAESIALFTTNAGVSVLLLSMFILIPFIYSKEHVSGVNQYQLSSINGRKRLLTAKLLSMSVFLSGVSLVIHLGIIGLSWYRFGIIDWSAPIQVIDGLSKSPYPFTIGQFIFVSFIFQTIVLISLGIWVLAISFFVKNHIQAIIWSGLLVGVPFLYNFVIPETFFPEIFKEIILFFPSRSLLTREVFETYQTINIGVPLFLPVIILLVQFLLTLIVLKVLYRASQRREAV